MAARTFVPARARVYVYVCACVCVRVRARVRVCMLTYPPIRSTAQPPNNTPHSGGKRKIMVYLHVRVRMTDVVLLIGKRAHAYTS